MEAWKRREFRRRSPLWCVGLLFLAMLGACNESPHATAEVNMPTTIPEITSTPTPLIEHSPLPLSTITIESTSTTLPSMETRGTFTPTPTPTITAVHIATLTPTEGQSMKWGMLNTATITAMAQDVVRTVESNNQIELAKQNLPEWYLNHVYSLVFRGESVMGFTGLRIDALSFTRVLPPDPQYEYFLVVEHVSNVFHSSTQLTLTDIDGNSATYDRDQLKFIGDDSNLGILAVKRVSPEYGVPLSRFLDYRDWSPDKFQHEENTLQALCFPYSSAKRAFPAWYIETQLNTPPLFRTFGNWQLALDIPSAGASSGCSFILKSGEHVLATMEGLYQQGGRANLIDTVKITELLLKFN